MSEYICGRFQLSTAGVLGCEKMTKKEAEAIMKAASKVISNINTMIELAELLEKAIKD